MIDVNQENKLTTINTPKYKSKYCKLISSANRSLINDDNEENKLRKSPIAKYKYNIVQIKQFEYKITMMK